MLRERATKLGQAMLRQGIHLVLPPSCLACDRSVGAAGTLCPRCWNEMRFIAPPFCACCGLPFEIEAGPDALCGSCAERLPVYRRARAAFSYEGVGRDLVLAYKMADRSWLAPRLAEWLHRAAAPLLPDVDLIAPVPLHRLRLLVRRFNQSAELAGILAKRSGIAAVPDLLVRTRRTRPQARLSAAERRRNMRAACAVRPGREAYAKGRRILLVDDVLTTGATAEACARALKQAGAASVVVVTLARALPDRP